MFGDPRALVAAESGVRSRLKCAHFVRLRADMSCHAHVSRARISELGNVRFYVYFDSFVGIFECFPIRGASLSREV